MPISIQTCSSEACLRCGKPGCRNGRAELVLQFRPLESEFGRVLVLGEDVVVGLNDFRETPCVNFPRGGFSAIFRWATGGAAFITPYGPRT